MNDLDYLLDLLASLPGGYYKPVRAYPTDRRSDPPVGEHAHKCDDCDHVWQHSDALFGDEAAHRCPSCGGGPQWRKHR